MKQISPCAEWNDCAPMGAIANLLILVVCLDLKSQLAPIHLEQLGAHRHLLAFWGGSEMLDVHLEADGGVPFGQICLYGLDAGTLHQPDHRWRGQHAIASHVLDHQLVVDCCDDLGFEPWCQATGWHVSLSRIEQHYISFIPFRLACPLLPTMSGWCTAIPSGVAILMIAFVIWMSACDGVGSPLGCLCILEGRISFRSKRLVIS